MLRVEEAEQQVDEGGFAAAAAADEGDGGAGGDGEIDVAQGPALGVAVTEPDIAELDAAAQGRKHGCRRHVDNGCALVENTEEAFDAGHVAAQARENRRELRDRLIGHAGEREVEDELADGAAAQQAQSQPLRKMTLTLPAVAIRLWLFSTRLQRRSPRNCVLRALHCRPYCRRISARSWENFLTVITLPATS